MRGCNGFFDTQRRAPNKGDMEVLGSGDPSSIPGGIMQMHVSRYRIFRSTLIVLPFFLKMETYLLNSFSEETSYSIATESGLKTSRQMLFS